MSFSPCFCQKRHHPLSFPRKIQDYKTLKQEQSNLFQVSEGKFHVTKTATYQKAHYPYHFLCPIFNWEVMK